MMVRKAIRFHAGFQSEAGRPGWPVLTLATVAALAFAVLGPVAPAVADNPAACTIYWNGANNDSWNTPADWGTVDVHGVWHSALRVPGSGDFACDYQLGVGVKTIMLDNLHVTVAGFQQAAMTLKNGATFTFTNTSIPSEFAVGANSGNLQIQGASTFTVPAGGTLVDTGQIGLESAGARFVNHGTLYSYIVCAGAGTTFDNAPGAVAHPQSWGSFDDLVGTAYGCGGSGATGRGTLNNEAGATIENGPSYTTPSSAVLTVNFSQGSATISGLTINQAGTLNAIADHSVNFPNITLDDDAVAFGSSSVVSGNGADSVILSRRSNTITSSETYANGASVAANGILQQSAGAMTPATGGAVLHVSGRYSLTGAPSNSVNELPAGATLDIKSGGTLAFEGGIVDGATIDNHGTVATGNAVNPIAGQGGPGCLEHGATLENFPGATVYADGQIYDCATADTQPGTLRNDQGATLTETANPVNSSSGVRGIVVDDAGTIAAPAGRQLLLEPNAAAAGVTRATVTLESTAVLTSGAGGWIYVSGYQTHGGPVVYHDGATIAGDGIKLADATFSPASGGDRLLVTGKLDLVSPYYKPSFTPSSVLSIASGATLVGGGELQGTAVLNHGTIEGDGIICPDQGTSIDNHGVIENTGADQYVHDA